MWNYNNIVFFMSVCLQQPLPSSAKFLFKKNCDFLNIYGINFYQQSIETCKTQCEIRSWCTGVHYFKLQLKCALLSSSEANPQTDDTRSCIYIPKGDMKDQNTCDCSEHQVCHPDSGVCSISKCPVYNFSYNAKVLGNMNQVGSRVKVKCDDRYEEIAGRDGAYCQYDGTWSSRLTCNLVHCEEPATKDNAVLERGSTRHGSVRFYQCLAGYGVNGLPNSTSISAICSYGTWIYSGSPACTELPPTLGTDCRESIQCRETESLCIEGKCFCSPLYRYDSTLKNCVNVCSHITDSFKSYNGIAFRGYNEYTLSQDKHCRQTCLADPRCMAYEFIDEDEVCTFAYVNMEMILDADNQAIIVNTYVVLYSRECAHI